MCVRSEDDSSERRRRDALLRRRVAHAAAQNVGHPGTQHDYGMRLVGAGVGVAEGCEDGSVVGAEEDGAGVGNRDGAGGRSAQQLVKMESLVT